VGVWLVVAESDWVHVWNLPNRVILASVKEPAVNQILLVDKERRMLTVRYGHRDK
jgi:hypothetical protein